MSNFGLGQGKMSHEEEDNSKLLNTIFLGEVASVQNYGAFVKIPGSRSQGLIHRSQISKVPVDDASEVLQRGESVWSKVISITDDSKLSLSMKVVDQGSGRDLDPNGVQIQQDEQRRKNYDPRSRKKIIELDAVFNTTCSKCGTRGHLAKDCFKSPEGKTYDLLPEEDEPPPSHFAQAPPQQPTELIRELKEKLQKKEKKKKKKHKKEKSKKSNKHKKSKKSRKSSSSSSSSEESPDERGKRRTRDSTGRESSTRKRRHSESPPRHREKTKR